MAEGEPESGLARLSREVSLSLAPHGGRVFLHHATPEDVNHSTIELKCWWSSGFHMLSTSVVIGDEKHKRVASRYRYDIVAEYQEEEIGWNLGDCPIMLSLYQVDAKWLTESADKNDGTPVFGQLTYYSPISTDDGVVNDKRPTVTAWVGVGADNFNLIRANLVEGRELAFDLGITVRFPQGSVESGWVDRSVKWDGNGPLPIIDATIVWKRHDWDADHDPELIEPCGPEPRVPPREHVELMEATNRLESAVAKLALPLWMAVATIVAIAVMHTRGG